MEVIIHINDNNVSSLQDLYKDTSFNINDLLNESLEHYINFLKLKDNYEKTDKVEIENWGTSHYIDPERDA